MLHGKIHSMNNSAATLQDGCGRPCDLLQASFVLLDVCVAARALLGDEVGQLLAPGVLVHALVEPACLHPFGHVFAAHWLVGLRREKEMLEGVRRSSISQRVGIQRKQLARQTDLAKVAGEAGAPVAFEAGASVHAIPPAEYLVAPLGVLTPGEPAAALHIGANHGLDVLQVCVCV